MKSASHLFIVSILTISVGTLLAAPSNGETQSVESEKATYTLESAINTIDNVSENPVKGIPQSLINTSEGIVIFPGACNVAAGPFNGPGGRGIAIIRNEDGTWSNPIFVTIREGSEGFKIGAPASDIVLLFKDRNDIMNIEKAEIILGGDVGVSAGPVHSGSSSGADVTFETDIYSYQQIKGRFAGASVNGSIVSYYENLSGSLYGIDDTRLDEIFNKIETPYNDQVSDLIVALNTYGE